ncbi:MAG: ribose ABC transporter permease [Erysipelothrix sp.]|nr:ribose ABC transporter permease [Erysipelothrix sp.]
MIIFRFLMKNIPFVGLVALMIFMSTLSRVFLSTNNILNILRQASINGVVAFGMMTVILSAGIDLSVGSVLAVSSMIMAIMITAGVNQVFAITVALIVGLLIGLVNGLLISKGKLQPMIATLSTMMVFRGVTLYISNGVPVSRLGDGFLGWIGRGNVMGIPTPVYVLIAVTIVMSIILNYTTFGKKVYAIGGNIKAARLSGIKVENMLIYVYMISGFLSALAGIILTSRIDSAVPTAGQSFELNAIAAVVIGGASLQGGRGRVVGTFFGILIIAVIANGLNIIGTSAYLQQIMTGIIIISAVIFDRRK